MQSTNTSPSLRGSKGENNDRVQSKSDNDMNFARLYPNQQWLVIAQEPI